MLSCNDLRAKLCQRCAILCQQARSNPSPQPAQSGPGMIRRFPRRVAEELARTRREIAARRRFGDLPAAIRLTPGELRITFSGAEDLAAKLVELSQAMAHDWTALSERSRNDPPFLTRRGDAQLLSAAPPAPHAHQVHPHARTAQRRDQAADPRRADLSGGTLLRLRKKRYIEWGSSCIRNSIS